jgi:subtilisin-like proprotein convertase family protein
MRRTFTFRLTLERLAITIALGALVSCSGSESALAPTPVVFENLVESPAKVSATGVPNGVFRTTPPADGEGTLVGQAPFTVSFNMCQSRPASEDDDLRYTYDFDGDGTIDTRGACRASYTYEASGGARACRPARVCVSDRRPDGEVCRSYEVCVDGGAEGREGPRRTQTFESANVPLALPDQGTAVSTTTVTGAARIESVTVSLHLVHSFVGDLDVVLTAPDGTEVALSTGNGGDGNFGASCAARTTFDSTSTTSIVGQPAPFTGTFRPEGALDALVGKSANGVWTLRVVDNVAFDEGTLLCWDVTITHSN